MPVSRGRKKNSKSNKKSNRKNHHTFDDGTVRITQRDNMTYLRNRRSAEEQKHFVEHVIENRPLFYEEIKQKINSVIEHISAYDKIPLLGVFSYYGITNQLSDDGAGEVLLEYAQSICTGSENTSKTVASLSQAKKIINELKDIRISFSHYYGSERIIGKYTKVESNIRTNMLLQSLFVRGDGYYQHIKEIFLELFTPHDQFFLNHYQFNAADIVDAFEQLEDSFCCRVVMPGGQLHPASYARFQNWNKGISLEETIKRGLHPIEAFGEDNPDLIVEDGKILTYSISEVNSHRGLFEIRPRNETHKKVIETLAIGFGDNVSFLNPDYNAEPLNDSKIFNYPIIRENDKYFLFGFNLAARNLIGIAENLIESKDKSYFDNHYLGNKYAKTRDNFLESKVESVFKRLLPSVKFYSNVKYTFNNDGTTVNCNKKNEKIGLIETELDLLGIGDDATYLIEIKAGALKPSARRGALKTLTSVLKEVVGYAACQSYRAQKFIAENEKPTFKISKTEISVNPKNPIYRISVSLDHFGGLMTYLCDLKDLDIIDKNVGFAWSVNIYDLMVFAEILDDEVDFKEYLKTRIELYSRENIHIEDEVSLLGYFLHEGNILFDNPKIKKLDSFKINSNYSSDIDAYLMREQTGATPIKPKKKR